MRPRSPGAAGPVPAGDARASPGTGWSGEIIGRAPPGRAARRAACGHRPRGYGLAAAMLLAHATVTLAADEPFRARVSEADGVVRVVVDVIDDHVVFDGPNADHVTLWLADEAVMADAEAMRRGFDEQRREVETALAEEPREPDAVKEVTDGLADAAQRWRDADRLLEAEIASGPRTPAAAPAASRYEIIPGGYRAILTIPLSGLLSPTSAVVKALRYRIAVSDVDQAEAAATTTTEAGRLTLRRRWRLQLDETQRIARALAPDGRFERRDGAYVYVRPKFGRTYWTFDGACCTPNVLMPGPWTPFAPRDVSRLKGLRLYVGPDAVLVVADGRRVRLELTNAQPLFQARRGGAHYLVFLDNQPSRAGSPTSMCGGGTETSVVWLELSPALVAQRRRSLLIDSCWYNLNSDYRTDATRVWGETDRIDYSSGAHTARITYSYDNEHPQRGLVTTTKPAAE